LKHLDQELHLPSYDLALPYHRALSGELKELHLRLKAALDDAVGAEAQVRDVLRELWQCLYERPALFPVLFVHSTSYRGTPADKRKQILQLAEKCVGQFGRAVQQLTSMRGRRGFDRVTPQLRSVNSVAMAAVAGIFLVTVTGRNGLGVLAELAGISRNDPREKMETVARTLIDLVAEMIVLWLVGLRDRGSRAAKRKRTKR
jgi:hypothetical protein